MPTAQLGIMKEHRDPEFGYTRQISSTDGHHTIRGESYAQVTWFAHQPLRLLPPPSAQRPFKRCEANVHNGYVPSSPSLYSGKALNTQSWSHTLMILRGSCALAPAIAGLYVLPLREPDSKQLPHARPAVTPHDAQRGCAPQTSTTCSGESLSQQAPMHNTQLREHEEGGHGRWRAEGELGLQIKVGSRGR